VVNSDLQFLGDFVKLSFFGSLRDFILGVLAEKQTPLQDARVLWPVCLDLICLFFKSSFVHLNNFQSESSFWFTEWCWIKGHHLLLELFEIFEIDFDINIVCHLVVAHKSYDSLQHHDEHGWGVSLQHVVDSLALGLVN